MIMCTLLANVKREAPVRNIDLVFCGSCGRHANAYSRD